MKKNQVNSILIDQTRRKNKIFAGICTVVVVFVLAVFSLYIYIEKSNSYYVTYDESSSIDYKVYLKDNDFFNDNYLDENNKYVASLINKITANFKYNISMDIEDSSFVYRYRIDAVVDVKEDESDEKSLYKKTVNLLEETSDVSNGSTATIDEDIDIDYNAYNDLIKSFNSVYDLDDIVSTLTVNLYVDVSGYCDDFDESKESSIVSLEIPLTTKTVNIDIKDNLVNSDNNILLCQKKQPVYYIFLVIGIVLIIVGSYIAYKLVKYMFVTRSAETIYEINLKRILNNYHSYIQKVSNKMSIDETIGLKVKDKVAYKDCQVYKLESFTDMLEIRDSISAPILMSESDDGKATYFMILDVRNKAIYLYALRVTDIKRNMKK